MADVVPEDVRQALDVAKSLIEAGIPVFAAPPCPAASGGVCSRPGHTGKEEYDLPPKWQQTVPSTVWLDRWQPGWALAAVGGHAADFLDIDPRNGGDASEAELHATGHWPRTYAEQETPSGGRHVMIAPLSERKGELLPGIDYQGGAPSGEGRGFVWIAPTVKRSKAAETRGERHPYRWVQPPDTGWLREGGDDTGEMLVARLQAMRTKPERTRDERESREFTETEAREFCNLTLKPLMQAQIGQIEERANSAAVQLSHFVPDFWDEPTAYAVLLAALGETAYDPDGPSSWTADKFHAVLAGEGNRAPGDWKAVRRPEMPEAPRGRIRRALLKRSDIKNLPRPVPLIEDVMFRSSVVVLSGKFGTYKSFVAVSWAASLATGKDWMGHAVPEPVPVLYAAAEGAYGIEQRLAAWEAAHQPIPDLFYLLPLAVRLNRPADMQELEQHIVETGAKVLIFDTLHASTPGVDENDSGEMGSVMDVLRGFQERHGICSILPHHTGHAGERARGSSSLEDDADTSFVIRIKGEDRGPDSIRTLVHRKAKDGPLLPDMDLKLQLVDGTGSGYVTHDPFVADEVEAAREVPWLPDFGEKDRWRARALEALYLTSPYPDGYAKSELLAVLEREYPGFDRRSGTWKTAWKDLVEAVDGAGEPIIGGATSAKYTVVSESVRRAMAARFHPDRLSD